jgi:hypothetical protein
MGIHILSKLPTKTASIQGGKESTPMRLTAI